MDENKKPRRSRGDDSIAWDKVNKCFVGRIALGSDENGKRLSRSVRGRTKTEVKDKLKILHEEIDAGIRTPATYTVRQCVEDWLDSLTLDAETVSQYRGQARKWIYPGIGRTKLKDFKATDADQFFKTIATQLSKRSVVMIKSTLRRSIRRAQVMELIGKNVAELVDLPESQPGRPSRAMTEGPGRPGTPHRLGTRRTVHQDHTSRQGQERGDARRPRRWHHRVPQQGAPGRATADRERRPERGHLPLVPVTAQALRVGGRRPPA